MITDRKSLFAMNAQLGYEYCGSSGLGPTPAPTAGPSRSSLAAPHDGDDHIR